MTTDERIDKLEEDIRKLQADHAVLKYVIEKESLTDQLVKICVNNASQQIPELVKLMEGIKIISEKEK